MDIDITQFFTDADPFDFARSIAETGESAGPDSWNNAMAEAERCSLLTMPEQVDALRDHMKGFGAWSEEEIVGWTKQECNAMFVQLVAGDIREGYLEGAGIDPDSDKWQAYLMGADSGRRSGNIFCGYNGKVYYSLSN